MGTWTNYCHTPCRAEQTQEETAGHRPMVVKTSTTRTKTAVKSTKRALTNITPRRVASQDGTKTRTRAREAADNNTAIQTLAKTAPTKTNNLAGHEVLLG